MSFLIIASQGSFTFHLNAAWRSLLGLLIDELVEDQRGELGKCNGKHTITYSIGIPYTKRFASELHH
jgi:hypothetical protein